jgi:hypothetical protein
MGFSLVWFGVQGKAKDEFLALAGFEDTGEPDDYFEAENSGGELPDGWYVLVSEDVNLAEPPKLAQWSAGARLIAVMIDEDSLTSLAMEWADGKQVWSIFHDGANGGDKLDVEGTLPPEFESIREELEAAGSGEEGESLAFDAAIDVAAAITGFRHDATEFDEDQPVFTALEEI